MSQLGSNKGNYKLSSCVISTVVLLMRLFLLLVGCLLRCPDAGLPGRASHHVVVMATQAIRRAR